MKLSGANPLLLVVNLLMFLDLLSDFPALVLGSSDEESEPCSSAQSKCVSRSGCSMALHNYYINCADLMHGHTDECSPRCQKALISLLSVDDQHGEAFMKCDCNNNELCESQKQKIEVCTKDVLAAMVSVNDDSMTIDCSLAHLMCSADTSCYTALSFYTRYCARMWRGDRCTSKCNNSLTILYRQHRGRKLRTCVCDGTEDFDCLKIQENTEKLCFSRTRSRHNHNHKYRHSNESSRTPEPEPDVYGKHTNNVSREERPVSLPTHSTSGRTLPNCWLLTNCLLFAVIFLLLSTKDRTVLR